MAAFLVMRRYFCRQTKLFARTNTLTIPGASASNFLAMNASFRFAKSPAGTTTRMARSAAQTPFL